jgi:hypothetical protein
MQYLISGRMARRRSRNILHDVISAHASCLRRFTGLIISYGAGTKMIIP